MAMSSSINDIKPEEDGFIKWAALILIGAAVYRLFFFTGFYGGDEVSYFHTMTDLMRENMLSASYFTPRKYDLYYLRTFLYLPSLLCFKLFGHSYSSALIPVFAYSLGTVLMLMFAGKKLFSPVVGLISGGIFAFAPISALYGTVFTPDTPVTFFITASWLAFAFAVRNIDSKKKSMRYFALTGVLTHLAFSAKEPGILLFGSYFLYLFFSLRSFKKAVRGLLVIAVFFLLSFLLMGLVFNVFTGSFLYQSIFFGDPFKVKQSLTGAQRPFIPPYLAPDMSTLSLKGYIKEYCVYAIMMLQWDDTFGLYGILLLSGIVYVLFFNKNKSREEKVLLYVTIFVLGYLNFGTPYLDRYVFLPKCRRYLIPMIPPLGIMAGIMLEKTLAKAKLRPFVYLLLTCVFLHGTYTMNGFCRYLIWGSDIRNWIGATRSVENKSKTPIYIAGNIPEQLKLFVPKSKADRLVSIRSIFKRDGTSDLGALKGSYVIYNDGYYYWREKTTYKTDFNKDFFQYIKTLTPKNTYCQNSTPLRDLTIKLGGESLIGEYGKRTGKGMDRHKVFIYHIP